MPKASEIVSMIQSITNLTGRDPEVKFFVGDDTTGENHEADFLSIYDIDENTIAFDIGEAFDAGKEE